MAVFVAFAVLPAAMFPWWHAPERTRQTREVIFSYEDAGAWERERHPDVFAYAATAGFGILAPGRAAPAVVTVADVPPEYPLLVTPPGKMIPPPMAAPIAEAVWHPRLVPEKAERPPAERLVIEMDEGLQMRELAVTGLTAEVLAGTTRPVGTVEASLRVSPEGRIDEVTFLPGHALDVPTLRHVEQALLAAQAHRADTATQGRLRIRWRAQEDAW